MAAIVRRILAIGFEKSDLRTLRSLTKKLGTELTDIARLGQRLAAIETTPFELVLLSAPAPLDFVSLVAEVRKVDTLREIPILLALSRDCPVGEMSDLVRNNRPIDFFWMPLDILEIQARIQLALDYAQRADELGRMAVLDALTGLYNRRNFEEQISREYLRSQRSRVPFCCLYLRIRDLDEHKKKLGQEGADHLVKEMAEALKNQLRATDICASYASNELAAMLLQNRLSDGLAVAGRLKRDLEKKPVQFKNKNVTVALSVGIFCYDDFLVEYDFADILRRARSAMDKAVAKAPGHIEVLNPFAS